MELTPAQKLLLIAAIQADPTANQFYVDGDLTSLANRLNTPVTAPAPYWVWRTDVSRQDVYTQQNDLPIAGAQTGFWNWTTFKGQAVAEQNAWVQMFMGDQADFSKPNFRGGVTAIFQGSAAANAQAAHVLAIGRRHATLFEKALAGGGAGTTADPAVMSLQSPISSGDLVGL